MEIVQAVKKLNSISRARLNFRRRPILCTTLYRNPIQASNFVGTFDQLFLWIFYAIFTEGAIYFVYTMVQKSQKWPKTQIKGGGGPALIICHEKKVGPCPWKTWIQNQIVQIERVQSLPTALSLTCFELIVHFISVRKPPHTKYTKIKKHTKHSGFTVLHKIQQQIL